MISIRYKSAHILHPFYVLRTCVRRPDCFPGPWTSWICASPQLAPKIVDLSVRFTIKIAFRSICSSLWASVAEGISTIEVHTWKKGETSLGIQYRNLRGAESVRPLAGNISRSWCDSDCFAQFWLFFDSDPRFKSPFFDVFSIICCILKVGMVATISLSLECLSILIRVSKNLSIFSRFFFLFSFNMLF